MTKAHCIPEAIAMALKLLLWLLLWPWGVHPVLETLTMQLPRRSPSLSTWPRAPHCGLEALPLTLSLATRCSSAPSLWP